MLILGVDPGIRHTGIALLRDGKVIYRDTLVPPQKDKLPYYHIIPFVLEKITNVLKKEDVEAAAVEEVAWYGRNRRVTLPLSHMAGSIIGLLLTNDIPVYVLSPTMKKSVKVKGGFNSSWDEHQKDAALLAQVAANTEGASVVEKSSTRSPLYRAARRKITAGQIVHWKRTKSA